MDEDGKRASSNDHRTGISYGSCCSPAIEITTTDKTVRRGNLPIRPSLEVAILYDGQFDDVFPVESADAPSINTSQEIKTSASTSRLVGLEAEIIRSRGGRGKLESIKNAFKELSPKARRKAKVHKRSQTTEFTFPVSSSRPFSAAIGYNRNFLPNSDNTDDEGNYFSETEAYAGERKRHSLDDNRDGKLSRLTHKTGLMSSVRNLFHLSKSESTSPTVKAERVRKLPVHIRQGSDSLVDDLNNNYSLSAEAQMRRATMDDSAEVKSRWKATRSRKLQKPIILIDSTETDSSQWSVDSGQVLCLISVSLALEHRANSNLEFEVQRLELSEVAAGISRLNHGESSDHLTQSDELSTLSRIEKLFPHDDLELNSSADKKPRRRRSAPSQILLKNLYRRSTPAGGELGMSKAPQDSTDAANMSPTDYVSRKFICESAVQLSAGVQTQQRYIFLFNDLLFIAKQRSSTSYKLKKRLLVSDLWINDYTPDVSESSVDVSKSFVIGWPTTNYVATFSTKELCDRWKEKLQSQITEEQTRDLPQTVTVAVAHKNTLQEQMAATLTVDRLADAKKLLQLTLQEFEIQNAKDTDYQLWVLSTKDDSVYPLFGHEQPFAIQLSHERDAEDLDQSIKCQFILRENKKQMKLERKPQKSGKKKKLPLSNIFSRKASGKLVTSPRSNSISEGKLFGHPLDELCTPNIPTPLMELLEHLYNCGPFTTEIFRKPSNAKRCQEMVNLMNSTEPEGWCKGCHNGILLASILKTFLRELPGKLCCSEYYNQWSDAINFPNDEEKTAALIKVIEQLPKGNELVLRHIICILSHIQDRSDSNFMTSYNLAVCLGPSLLWNESSEKSEQEASSKTVPQIVQFLIENCQQVFGKDILDIFGHPPIAPLDSDTEDLSSSSRLITPYNDSLESLSDTEGAPRNPGGLTQMSPSSCSRDSGLILSDPHEGEHSDDHSLRQEIIKSKSCDSLSQPEHRNLRKTLAPLQTQVSSDSLDCDDEYIELGSDCNFLLTKSKSGGHLCFNRKVDSPSKRSNERLGSRLANTYSTEPTSKLLEVEYSSSDSDKSARSSQQKEWLNTDLHKSSTNSSLQQGSSSSDDTQGLDFVTHRHINSPKILESENGYHPRDFLQQFTNKLQNEESHKKKLRELMRQKTEPLLNTDTDEDDISQSVRLTPTASRNPSHRHLKHANSTGRGSPRILRTNTYGGRSDRRQRTADVNMLANMAETRPIMPQQYRPNRPPPYREALERKEKMKSSVSEMERIKQTVNSARAKQMYAQSLQLFERQEVGQGSAPPSSSGYSKASQASIHNNNNNTIGVVQTSDKRFVFKRAPSAKHSMAADAGSSNIFYQPSSGITVQQRTPQSSSNSFANSFYRPTQPPPYKEVMKTRASKPDLIDSLGGESLV